LNLHQLILHISLGDLHDNESTHSICVDYQLDSIVDTVQNDSVQESSDCAVLVFPSHISTAPACSICRKQAYQLAAVARGILASSGMTLSSKFLFDSTPGFSCASTACALLVSMDDPDRHLTESKTYVTESRSMSPPKYLDKSPKIQHRSVPRYHR
jgi:hypothetical protein